MKTTYLLGLSLLVSLSAACADEADPSPNLDERASSVSGRPPARAENEDGKPDEAVVPMPTPGPLPVLPDRRPTPYPVDPIPPAPACTPLPQSTGTANPASVYCGALGYAESDGTCNFPDGSSCDVWAFYRGECGQSFSFCSLHGGTVSAKTEDMGTWTATYAVCNVSGRQCKETDFAHSCVCP